MAYQPKSYKKFVATAATATLVASAVVPAAFANEAETAAFTDVPKSYEAAIDFVVSNNISKGLTETKYGIDAQIKRGDVAIIIANAAGLNNKDAKASGFKDVPTRGTLAVNSLKAAGIVDGKSTTNFGFADPITRGEAAIMIQRAFKITGDVKDVKFTDVSDRYDDAVAALLAYKVTQGTSTTKFGTQDPIKRGDFAKFIYALKDLVKVETPVAGPVVSSVKAINAKQVEVKFGKAVDKSTVLNSSNMLQNITFTQVGLSTVEPGALTGVLSEDGKTLTVTAKNTFDGEYAFKSTDKIKTTDGEEVKEYTAIVKADDTNAPKLLSSSASARTSTNSIALIFDEPVNAEGAIVYVNGEAGTVNNNSSNPNRLDVTSNSQLAAGSTATVSLTNVKDYNGNFVSPNPLTTSVAIIADTVAPTVVSVKSVGENTIEVKYNKDMDIASFANKARLVSSTGTVTNLAASKGDDAKTVVLTTPTGFTYTDTYNALLFIDAQVKDIAGNSAAAYSSSVVLNKDVTAPTLSSVKFEEGKIVATFSENILDGDNNTITAINQATGEATKISLSSANSVIDKNTLTITQALANGTYQLRLPANTVTDTAGEPNGNAIATTNFVVQNTVASDTVRPTVTAPTNTPDAPALGVAPGTEQTVTYTAADLDGSGIDLATIRNLSNYTWDGKALPAGSYITTALTGPAEKATSVAVTIHIPSAQISERDTAIFTVSNIKDNAGNTIAAVGTGNVTLADGVKPEFTSAAIASNGTSLVLGFSESVKNVNKGDFEITLNGTLVPLVSVGSVDKSNTEINKYVTSLTAAVANNATTNGGTVAAPRDIVYINADATPGLSAGDIILQVLPETTYGTDTTITVDLSAGYVNSLAVELVEESGSVVADDQGNTATFGKEIKVK